MIDDAGADKGIAIPIKIHAPWVARAFSEDFELFCARLKARHGGRHENSVVLRLVGLSDPGSGEYPMSHIKPAIGTPGKAIQKFMTILQSKPCHDHLARV